MGLFELSKSDCKIRDWRQMLKNMIKSRVDHFTEEDAFVDLAKLWKDKAS